MIMEEVRLLLREEGREARNLLAFHVSANDGKMFRKPPTPRILEPKISKKNIVGNICPRSHIRSASTGRDKRSELRARYWALLFGNLQRAVNEIYNTVELHESIVECQETILVMENYIKDFYSLIEWFKLKWDYENTPAPQRPTSLAWEVRKANLPTSPHCERISPSPAYKQGRISPQNKLNLPKDSKIENSSSTATSPIPEPIPEVDEKIKEVEEKSIASLKRENSEIPLSPSEDQKIYINVIKKACVSSAEIGTITEDIEKRKTLAQKISQASQTDEEPSSNSASLSPPSKLTKPDVKPVMRSTIPRAPYSSAVSRAVKPTVKTGSVKSSNVSSRVSSVPLSKIASTKSVGKTQPRPPLKNSSTLLRSKTSGEIKTFESKPKINNSFIKQRTSINIRNGSSNIKTQSRISTSRNNIIKKVPDKIEAKPVTKVKEGRESDRESITSSVETIVNCVASNNATENENSSKLLPNGVLTDGWLTVKCRSRFKSASKNERRPSTSSTSHWANRFNEISATTSLPALALLQESDNDGEDEKSNSTSPQNAKISYLKRTNTILTKSSIKSVSRRNNEYLRTHKSKSEEPCLPPKKENKDNDEKQTKTLNKIGTRKSSEDKKVDVEKECENIKQIEDYNESQDEEEHCRKTQQLSDEEAALTQEIAELQNAAVDVDTETDGTETDGEAGDDDDTEVSSTPDDDLSLEARYEPVLAGLSWGERMDTLAALEDLVARHPGRALQLHQKLSNPERRRALPETLRRYQAKHARAQQRRQALQQERAVRLQALLARVQDVKAAKNQLIEEKRVRMENRLQKAELKRTEHLKSVIRKAHDEEEKLREIAFIKELEAQNKRHDFLELCKEQKGRLEDLREGQRKKIEEQAARGAAVEERRRALEQARHDRLERLQAERELRAERVGRRQLEIQEQAREKARGREERLSALHAQQLATTRELQKRISQKQEESARRHEENIEQIRQKALELSILRSHDDEPHTPALTPYESQKMCTVCNVHINSEVYLQSHLRGRAHQEAVRLATGGPLVGDLLGQYELAHIVDAPDDDNHPRLIAARERTKILRKRCKKIRQRMTSKGAQFEANYKPPILNTQNKRQLGKSGQKCLQLISQGWASTTYNQLDRVLGETNRLLIKKDMADLEAFQASGWFSVLSKLLTLGVDSINTPPLKSMVTACNVWQAACRNGVIGASNCSYTILSNKIIIILDLLNSRLKAQDGSAIICLGKYTAYFINDDQLLEFSWLK